MLGHLRHLSLTYNFIELSLKMRFLDIFMRANNISFRFKCTQRTKCPKSMLFKHLSHTCGLIHTKLSQFKSLFSSINAQLNLGAFNNRCGLFSCNKVIPLAVTSLNYELSYATSYNSSLCNKSCNLNRLVDGIDIGDRGAGRQQHSNTGKICQNQP